MEAADKIAAVQKYVEAFDKQDINLIKDLYADNATVEDPVGTELKQGIDAIVEFYQGAFDMGAKLTLSNEAPRCAGNSVAFAFSVKVGDMTIEPIDVFEFDSNGKVVSMRAYWGPENTSQ